MRPDHGTDPKVVRIPERLWLSAASRLVSQTAPNREAAARRLVAAAPVHGIDLSLMWGVVGRDGPGSEYLRQVVLAVPGAGRTLMLFQSEPGPGGDIDGPSVALRERVASINAACAHFGRPDVPAGEKVPEVRLAQGLPEPAESWAVAAFERAGFMRVGNLAYLKKPIRDAALAGTGVPRAIEWPEGIRVRSCAELGSDLRTDAALLVALDSSYLDTLDCPELCGLRETKDVLASHRATGVWDPALWWLVFEESHGAGEVPRGCMLLNRCPEQRAVELVYIGLAPTVRGRGVASKLLDLAIRSARGPTADELTCAVDRRNQPALNLYGRAGFKPIADRVAFVRPLGG